MPGERHEVTTINVPVGTLASAPLETDTSFNPGMVLSVQIVTPGVITTGIRIAVAHQVVLPYDPTQWIMGATSAQTLKYALEGWPEGGQWSVFNFNTSGATQQWNVTYTVREIPIRVEPPRVRAIEHPVTAADIHAAAVGMGLNQPE